MGDDASHIIAAIRQDIEQAADVMLSAAELGLRDMAAAREGHLDALERIERTLGAILEACAFQDIAGQRLSKLSAALGGQRLAATPADPLLAGPALHGEGLKQADADRLMNAPRGAI